MSETISQSESIKSTMLKAYPSKVAKKRGAQIVVNEKVDPSALDADVPPIKANVRTTPGIITQRGCCYAGCKGVVLGPTRDIINLVHGPIGCSFYAWLTRRNQTRPPSLEHDNFMTYMFSTDLQESEIIFGGEKKLAQAIREAYDLFRPKAIGVFATCPVGLIGDDVHAVSRQLSEELGINIFGFSCEGYKGVSQSAGHHIANNQLFKHVVGRAEEAPAGKFRVNLLGEYNIGGDAFLIEDLFERCGITLCATFSGNSSMEQFERSHLADLNLVMCHRSINYIAQMIEEKYGVPWIKVNFIGAEATAKALRRIGVYFEDEELQRRIEEVIAEEMDDVEAAQRELRPRLEGKTAMLFVGGSRAHSYQGLFSEVGMRTVVAGYEFAHRDDYEGRKVLPSIKVDADSRNIEELKVEPHPEQYRARLSEEGRARLAERGLEFSSYGGMMPTMESGTLIVDDISEHETEVLLRKHRPDVFCAGIKEKYGVQKFGVPCKQLHSYDYGGPYAAFGGAINFFREIDRMVNASVWTYLKAPWSDESPTAKAVD